MFFNFSLIKYLIGLKGDSSSVILDSFAGSGSTMHAVIDQNNIEKESNLISNQYFFVAEKIKELQNKII